MAFELLQNIILSSFDETEFSYVEKLINYLLHEDPLKKITIENVQMGLNEEQQEYFETYMFVSDSPKWYRFEYEFIDKLAANAAKKVEMFDELFANKQMIDNLVEYLNILDRERQEFRTDGNRCRDSYFWDEIVDKICFKHQLTPVSNYNILIQYMNKNIRNIIIKYFTQKLIEKVNSL